MSSFYGFEIAKTGLFISQKSINLTGHNIANANSVGYTRQRFVTQGIEPGALGDRFCAPGKGSVGGGVEVQVLEQMRSDFIDRQYREENSVFGSWNKRAEELEFIETMFNETSDTSITVTLEEFFNSMQELSKDPVNEEIRTNVQQNAIKMTETFNHYYNQLVAVQKVQNQEMGVTVEHINDLVSNIATYNKQIYSYELSGEKANDLRDKRNVLLDELSGLVNIEYTVNSDDHLIVSVEGVELVNHTTATLLEARPELTCPVTGETGFYEIYLEGTNTVFNYTSGELAAYRGLRDGNAVDDIGIPRIIDNLNTLARSLAEEYNAVHSAGYTMPHGAAASQTGINLFEVPGGNYNLVTAKTFSLSAEVKDSSANIAASDQLIDLSLGNNQKDNNKNALKMVELAGRSDLPVVGSFSSYLKSTITELAIESSHSQKIAAGQQLVVANLENRRQSISGVSIDEEMIQMVRFQHSYSASSRVISALDEALDVLINRTGSVGR